MLFAPETQPADTVSKSPDKYDEQEQDISRDNGAECTEQFRSVPFVMLTISMLQFAVFQFDVVTLEEYKNGINIGSTGLTLNGPLTKLLIFDLTKLYELWRFGTYMFVHYGFYHLIGNLIVQILLGIPLEMRMGGRRIFILYMWGVLASAAVMSITRPGRYLVGSSGGVYTLIGVQIADVLTNWKKMFLPVVQLFGFVLFWVYSMGIALSIILTRTSPMSYVTAYFAGFVLGFVQNEKIKRSLINSRLGRWKYFVYTLVVIGIFYAYLTITSYVHTYVWYEFSPAK